MAVGWRVVVILILSGTFLCAERVVVDAKLLKFTPAPELREIRPYSRALCTFLYEVQKVHEGKYTQDRILVVKWGIWNRKPVAGLPAQAGTTERLTLERWIDRPEFKNERVVDGVREIELVMYYDAGSQPEESEISIGSVLKGRQEELDRGVVRGEGPEWLFLTEELRHAQTGRFWEKDWKVVSRAGVDPLPAMLDFQARLQALGVKLLLVPLPTKVSLYPRQLKEGMILAPQKEYTKVLRKAGLEVADIEALFGMSRGEDGSPRPVKFIMQDSHLHPHAYQEVGRAIAQWVRRDIKGDPDRFKWGPLSARSFHGDLARMLPTGGWGPEATGVRNVFRVGAEEPGVGLSHPESPLVLLGDSNITVFSEAIAKLPAIGAGIPDYCAHTLGVEADVIASHGDGVHQARVNLYQQRSINPRYPDYWKNKKWLAWVFSEREFTQAERWSTKIPVAPPAKKR